MSAQDKNKIFFGLVHYIFSEQSNVDWIFKTSIINYTGAKQTIGGGEGSTSELKDIINFIYDMKPYHTQFSEFLQTMEIESETVNVSIEEEVDFNQRIRFDNVWSSPDKELQQIVIDGKTPPHFWYETTMANRLYAGGLRDLDELKIELRADFKGKIINGGSSSDDKIGYDILMYDDDQYDSPSIIYDYCIRDFNEDFSKEDTAVDFSYKKEFPIVGTTNFVFESDEGVDKSNLSCTIYRKISGKTLPLTDFSIVKSGNYQFSMFQPLNEDDKLIIRVLNASRKVQHAFVYVGSTFVIQDSEKIRRKIIPMTEEITVNEPESNIASNRLLVVKQLQGGSRVPFLNYTKQNGMVIAQGFKDKEHIILSTFDYQYIYDMTLDYSDPNARSNNTVIYTGDNFLRPEYNEDRPEDLCVAHFSENTTFYFSDNTKYTLDFKDENTHNSVSKAYHHKITGITVGSAGFVVAFSVDDIKDYPKDKPFIVQVGEELIKVCKISGNVLGNLIRGYNGTPLHTDVIRGSDIAIGEDVYVVPDIGSSSFEPVNKTISYQVDSHTEQKYGCPFGTTENDKIEVYRLEDGAGVPVLMETNQYVLKTKKTGVFGTVVKSKDRPTDLAIKDTNGMMVYQVRDKSVYDKNNKVVGVYKRNAILDLRGNKLGKINAENEFVTTMVYVIPLIKLNVNDVIHISSMPK